MNHGKKIIYTVVFCIAFLLAVVIFQSELARLNAQDLSNIRGGQAANCQCADSTTCTYCNLDMIKCTSSNLYWDCFQSVAGEYCGGCNEGDLTINCGTFYECTDSKCRYCTQGGNCVGCNRIYTNETPCNFPSD